MSALANIQSWLPWHYWDAGGGAALWEGIGETMDALADWFRLALRCRFPSVAPDRQALSEIAYGQHLDPPRRLTIGQVRRYLADPWTKWAHAGARGTNDPEDTEHWGLLNELALLGLINARIVSWRDLVNGGQEDAFGGDSSCFYLYLPQPNPFTAPITWNGGSTWNGGAHWGLEGPNGSLLPAIRRVLERWKGAGTSCRFLQIDLPDNTSVRVPMYEWWEPDANGDIDDYFNSNFV